MDTAGDDPEDIIRDAFYTGSNPDTKIPELRSFIRVMDSLCAWTTAVRYIVQRRISHAPVSIRAAIIDPRTPLIPGTEEQLYARWKARGHWDTAIMKKAKSIIRDSKFRVPRVGACHCEAGLMAAVLASALETQKNEKAGVPRPNGLNGVFEVQEFPNSITIGVAKKCCTMCSMLGEVLPMNALRVNLPGRHSTFVPWIAPEWLPLRVLQFLEGRVLLRVGEMI
ncbi:hypothetical protein FB45DRAFT_904184, partial [Roridomyces roridus]